MSNANKEMCELMAQFLSAGDIFAGEAIAEISAFVIKKRNSLKMTQKEFADKLGVSQSMISKWESADYNFTVKAIAQIAEKLDMTFKINFVPIQSYSEKTSAKAYRKSTGEYLQTTDSRITTSA